MLFQRCSRSSVTHWTFQHDGATAHSDKKTNKWLASNVPHFLPSEPNGEWPAKSPDLNWIENLWSIVAWRVSEGKVPETLSQIPDETLRQCASGMPETASRQEEGLCITDKMCFLFLFTLCVAPCGDNKRELGYRSVWSSCSGVEFSKNK